MSARAEVVETLTRPVTTYPSDPHYGLGRRVAVRSRLAVVYAESDWTVITVLWDGQTSRDDGPRAA